MLACVCVESDEEQWYDNKSSSIQYNVCADENEILQEEKYDEEEEKSQLRITTCVFFTNYS